MKQLWRALMLVRRADGRLFWRRVVYVVLQSVLPLVNLWLLKQVVDSVELGIRGEGMMGDAMGLLVGMTAVFLLGRVVGALAGINSDLQRQKVVDYMADIMQTQAARMDMEYYDNPDYHDSMHRAQQEASTRPVAILNNYMSLFGAVLSLVGVVWMMTEATWWIVGVMLLAVVPSFAVRLYKARRIYRFRRENTQLYRRTGYYGGLLGGRDYAREMRAYGIGGFFRARFVENRRVLVRRLIRISRRLGAMDVVCGVVEAGAMFLVLWILIRQTFGGAIGMGMFVMLFEAFRKGQSSLSNLVSAVAALYDSRLFVGNLFDFLDLRPRILSPAEPLPMPEKIESVSFRNVCFRYADMDRDVLHDFSLTAQRGNITRIDGENGYGKSTLIKLLLRLYDPCAGEVLINGIDIRRFDVEELRKKIGVLFQDFVRYQCTAAENIGFFERERVQQSAREAEADGLIEKLPRGYDNMLGRMFDGGAELSMGQWQRVAIGRVLCTDAEVMVFDEPTAWMDMPTRERFFQMLEEKKRDRIIILITHT